MDAPSKKPQSEPYNFNEILRGKPYTVGDIIRGSDDNVDYKQLWIEMAHKNPLMKPMPYSESEAKLTVRVAVCMDSMLMDINELEDRNKSLENKLEEVTAVKDSFQAKFTQAEEARIKMMEHAARLEEELAALKKPFNLVPKEEEVDHAA